MSGGVQLSVMAHLENGSEMLLTWNLLGGGGGGGN